MLLGPRGANQCYFANIPGQQNRDYAFLVMKHLQWVCPVGLKVYLDLLLPMHLSNVTITG